MPTGLHAQVRNQDNVAQLEHPETHALLHRAEMPTGLHALVRNQDNVAQLEHLETHALLHRARHANAACTPKCGTRTRGTTGASGPTPCRTERECQRACTPQVQEPGQRGTTGTSGNPRPAAQSENGHGPARPGGTRTTCHNWNIWKPTPSRISGVGSSRPTGARDLRVRQMGPAIRIPESSPIHA